MTVSNLSSSSSKPVSELLRRKDRQALEQLLTWYRPLLLEIAKDLLGPKLVRKIDASDVVQETLNDVTKAFPNVTAKTRSEWKGYLYRILSRRVYDTKKRFLGNMKRDIAKESYQQQFELIAGELHNSQLQDPFEQMINKEFASQVLAIIRHFPKDIQRLLHWRYRKEMTYQQIGDRVGRSKDDVRMLIQRCIESIRKELESHD